MLLKQQQKCCWLWLEALVLALGEELQGSHAESSLVIWLCHMALAAHCSSAYAHALAQLMHTHCIHCDWADPSAKDTAPYLTCWQMLSPLQDTNLTDTRQLATHTTCRTYNWVHLPSAGR